MPFRFSKSFRLFPGLRLNVSKSGVSFTARIFRFLTFNVGKRGARVTADMPGTGLSWWGWLFRWRK